MLMQHKTWSEATPPNKCRKQHRPVLQQSHPAPLQSHREGMVSTSKKARKHYILFCLVPRVIMIAKAAHDE